MLVRLEKVDGTGPWKELPWIRLQKECTAVEGQFRLQNNVKMKCFHSDTTISEWVIIGSQHD